MQEEFVDLGMAAVELLVVVPILAARENAAAGHLHEEGAQIRSQDRVQRWYAEQSAEFSASLDVKSMSAPLAGVGRLGN